MKINTRFFRFKQMFFVITFVFSFGGLFAGQLGRPMKMGNMKDFGKVMKQVEKAMERMDQGKMDRMNKLIGDAMMSGRKLTPEEQKEIEEIGKELNQKIEEIRKEEGDEPLTPAKPQPPVKPTPPRIHPNGLPVTSEADLLSEKALLEIEKTLNELSKSLSLLRQKISAVEDVKENLGRWLKSLDLLLITVNVLKNKPAKHKKDLGVKDNLELLKKLQSFSALLKEYVAKLPSTQLKASRKDYYIILRAPFNATTEEIENKYKEIVKENSKEYLEEKYKDLPLTKEEIDDVIKRKLRNFELLKFDIEEAYNTLKDEKSRALFDAQRKECLDPALNYAISVVDKLLIRYANDLINQLNAFIDAHKSLEEEETLAMKVQDEERQKKLELYRKQRPISRPIIIGGKPFYPRGNGVRPPRRPSYRPGERVPSGYRIPGRYPWNRQAKQIGKPGTDKKPGSRQTSGKSSSPKKESTTQKDEKKDVKPPKIKSKSDKIKDSLKELEWEINDFNKKFYIHKLEGLREKPEKLVAAFRENPDLINEFNENRTKFTQETLPNAKIVAEIIDEVKKDVTFQSWEKLAKKKEKFLENIDLLQKTYEEPSKYIPDHLKAKEEIEKIDAKFKAKKERLK